MQFNDKDGPEVTEGGGMFIQLKDGESVKGVPRGENKGFYVKWDGSRYIPAVKGEEDAKFRFKFNLVVNVDGVWTPKIFEQGSNLWRDMKTLAEDYSLSETVVKITRKGTGTDTRYHIMPMPAKLSEENLKDLSGLELCPLKTVKNHAPGADNGPSFDSDEELPF